MMNSLTVFVFLLLALSFASASRPKHCPYVDVVSNFDESKYAGLWYEIATSPSVSSIAERGCYCTRANYTVNPDTSLTVKNACNVGSVQGPQKVVVGKAMPDPESPAKLNVTFGSSPPGPYWIIVLDPNYQVAVVWSCQMVDTVPLEFMWVLGRNPSMDARVYTSITKQAEYLTGYNVNDLDLTTQNGCVYH